MRELNLPSAEFRFRSSGQSKEIFDSFRRKFIVLTPEEWVRQHFAVFLRDHLLFPQSMMGLEVGLKFNQRIFRADIVIYDRSGKPWMIVECKSPDVKISDDVFFQASRYHLGLGASYLVVTNGIQHYCCELKEQGFEMNKDFPLYPNHENTP